METSLPENILTEETPRDEAYYEVLADELSVWAQRANEWLIQGDYSRPLPELRSDVVTALHQDAKDNPHCEMWLKSIGQLIEKAQAAREARFAGTNETNPNPASPDPTSPESVEPKLAKIHQLHPNRAKGDHQPQTP